LKCFTIPFHKFSLSLSRHRAVVVYIYFILLRNRNKSAQTFFFSPHAQSSNECSGVERWGERRMSKVFLHSQNPQMPGRALKLLLLLLVVQKKIESVFRFAPPTKAKTTRNSQAIHASLSALNS
jgi:hypothetical protein